MRAGRCPGGRPARGGGARVLRVVDGGFLVEERGEPGAAALRPGQRPHRVDERGEGLADGDGHEHEERRHRCADGAGVDDEGRGDGGGGRRQQQERGNEGPAPALPSDRRPERRVRVVEPAEGGALGPDGAELAGLAGDQVADPRGLGARREQLVARLRLRPPGEEAAQRDDDEEGGDDEAHGGGEPRRQRHGDEPRDGARQDRDGDPDLGLDDVGEVVDDPGEHLRPGPAPQPCRGQGHQGRVDGAAPLGEVGQGRVVGDDALEVAEERPGHAEGTDGDDGREEGEDDGPLARPDHEPS